MAPEFVLRPEFYDVDWDKLPEPENIDGLQFTQIQQRNEWIVKLQFEQAGVTSCGTAFYVNIPEAKYHVILTAGHNLVDSTRKRSKNLRILSSVGEAKIEQKLLKIFVSASYEKNPSQSNAENDYGAILISKERSGFGPRGFGFSLKLGHDNLHGQEMNVSGYRVASEPGQPHESTGVCIRCGENQLKYDVVTEKGFSGSPVFIGYKGYETAIAIHNNGRERHGRGANGSRGSRLNEYVLGEIFSWIDIGYRSKWLKVSQPKAVHGKGLYLRFPPDEEHGWVRLGHKGLETSFDVIPACAPTSTMPNSHMNYVFRFNPPRGWPRPKKEKWVLWDVVKQCVYLTSTLQEYCFPRIIWDKKNTDAFRIVLPDHQITNAQGAMGGLVEFRMQATEIIEEDIEMGVVDTPEVSFEKYLKGKKAKFNDFCFKSVK
ncbi:hypothetical protein B7463_g4983, partial [Scytalidium lignicola]